MRKERPYEGMPRAERVINAFAEHRQNGTELAHELRAWKAEPRGIKSLREVLPRPKRSRYVSGWTPTPAAAAGTEGR